MGNNSKFDVGEIVKSLLVLTAGLAIVFGVSVALGKWRQPENSATETAKIVTCPNDFDSFTNTKNNVTLLDNKVSSGNEGILKGYKFTVKRKGLTANIICGYLMYEISFGGRPIEQKYMSLFMRPTDSLLGGHMWPDENRGAIIKVMDNKTQVIMPLDTITYDGTTKHPIKQANWASLLNVSDSMQFQVALSADVKYGNIDLLQIAYKCINKDTGKEDNETCSLDRIELEPWLSSEK